MVKLVIIDLRKKTTIATKTKEYTPTDTTTVQSPEGLLLKSRAPLMQ